MKKFNYIILTALLLLSFTATGCKSTVQNGTATENQTTTGDESPKTSRDATENDNSETRGNSPRDQSIFEENEERDNTEIDKRYKEVDKSKLNYDKSYSSLTYYETENSFVGSEAGIPNIDNKKYKDILIDYTYARDVNPTKVTYEDAIKLAKSVLPNDIKEIRNKYDNSTGKTYIVYSSNQGNFVLGLAYDYDESHNSGFTPNSKNNTIVGINYMKEITEQ
ncbi:hypothetical protein CBU02nite_40320 [Clostridium butyricum]|uniref:Lipoprotein n=1 Tax=Clostridium butyricum TaxID=1492 RepID=A0A512TTE6_CLOBU|nr:hypothetical protein [Clostridium butyricum]NOW25287.1 hypothetical protein [Clostridium butyricum]GEQ23526.1 hypothetical protein CBU02nite_40320 [Clostridium butyricum]